jgi:hypothetical protein
MAVCYLNREGELVLSLFAEEPRVRRWIEAARRRLHHNVLAVALANKLARIAWSVLAHGRHVEARKIPAATAQGSFSGR